MGKTTDLRRELKRRFYPFAAEHGFQIDTSPGPSGVDFRRFRAEGIDVFNLQWEKYGRPRFIVNFGQCPPDGATHFGERIAPDKVQVYMGSASGRLYANKSAETRSWFCQDHGFFRRVLLRQRDRPAAEVVDELLCRYQELEEWFQHRRIGLHLRMLPYPWQKQAEGPP